VQGGTGRGPGERVSKKKPGVVDEPLLGHHLKIYHCRFPWRRTMNLHTLFVSTLPLAGIGVLWSLGSGPKAQAIAAEEGR